MSRYDTELKLENLYAARGDRLCRRCTEPIGKNRSKWCSKACSDAAFAEMMFAKGSSTHIRKAVFERDGGICRMCGTDGEKLQRISNYVFHQSLTDHCNDAFDRSGINRRIFCVVGTFRVENRRDNFICDYFKRARKLWANTPLNFGFSCWQADHIVEVAGGGEHRLENLQTLCNLCHKEKTRRFVKSRNLTKQTVTK